MDANGKDGDTDLGLKPMEKKLLWDVFEVVRSVVATVLFYVRYLNEAPVLGDLM